MEKADIVVVATPWPEFAEIGQVGARMVFDYWRILPDSALSPSTRIVYPGVGPSPIDEALFSS
jgi:hypothetical protein